MYYHLAERSTTKGLVTENGWMQWGYANARAQVAQKNIGDQCEHEMNCSTAVARYLASRCAVVLRDLIMPYPFRRMKADVNVQLYKPKRKDEPSFLYQGLLPCVSGHQE